MDVETEMLAAGGERIVETVFYAANGKQIGVPSKWFNQDETGALSLSRAAMDLRLLERAKAIGVEVSEECSVVGLSGEKDTISNLKIRQKDGGVKEIFADFFVDATGRARTLGKMAEKRRGDAETRRRGDKRQTKFVGFKAHMENVCLETGVCEIYFFRGGYGGLSRIENGLANFCFLMKAETVKEFSGNVSKIIEQVIFKNERAYPALKDAVPVHDWLAVSVDGFGPKNLNPAPNLFAVGDAGAFIDPFTGSGMLMAFESAEILAEAMAGNSSAAQIAEQYKTQHAGNFGRRLFLCSLMRRAAASPTITGNLISLLGIGNLPRKILAGATRRARRQK